MRIVLHQDAVVERPRLALVGVDAEIDWPRMVFGQEGPFDAGRKARAPAAAQARVLHEFRDFVGAQAQRFPGRLVSAIGLISRQELAALFADAF